MDFAIAKVSTKGQIVIPSNMRTEIDVGDEFLMVRDGEKIILKSIKSLASDLKGDLKFAERVERAWKDHDAGKFEKKSKDEFLKELRAC